MYNETKSDSIYPTPAIGGVGLIENLKYIKGFKMKSNAEIFLVGKTKGHLDLIGIFTQFLGEKFGNPPELNLNNEYKNGIFIQKAIRRFRYNWLSRHFRRRYLFSISRDVYQ